MRFKSELCFLKDDDGDDDDDCESSSVTIVLDSFYGRSLAVAAWTGSLSSSVVVQP